MVVLFFYGLVLTGCSCSLADSGGRGKGSLGNDSIFRNKRIDFESKHLWQID